MFAYHFYGSLRSKCSAEAQEALRLPRVVPSLKKKKAPRCQEEDLLSLTHQEEAEGG
jgi:hypothetical protein